MEEVDDRAARFERICEAHTPAVLAYALRRTTPENAADVAADTFLVAWRRLDEIDEATALPWLYAVARRTLSSQRRATRRQRAVAERIAMEPAAGADPGVPRSHPVLAALARLSEADREVLMLAAWEELPGEDAARVLGCSATAYRIRLHRARKRLRDHLTMDDLGHSTTLSTRTEESPSC